MAVVKWFLGKMMQVLPSKTSLRPYETTRLFVHLVPHTRVCLSVYYVSMSTLLHPVCLAPIWHKMSHAASNLCAEHFMSGLQFGYTKTIRELWLVTSCELQRARTGTRVHVGRFPGDSIWKAATLSLLVYLYVYIFYVFVSVSLWLLQDNIREHLKIWDILVIEGTSDRNNLETSILKVQFARKLILQGWLYIWSTTIQKHLYLTSWQTQRIQIWWVWSPRRHWECGSILNFLSNWIFKLMSEKRFTPVQLHH